jgi:hypothetical protein
MQYRVDLAPSGKIRLWYDEFTAVELPSSLVGLDILREILQHAQLGRAKIAQPSAPTQAQVDEYVRTWRLANPEPPELIDWEDIEL